VNSAIRIHNVGRHAANLEAEGGVLEGLLHHARAEFTKVTTVAEGAAIAGLRRDLHERVHKLLAFESTKRTKILLQLCNGLLLGPRDLLPRAPGHLVKAEPAAKAESVRSLRVPSFFFGGGGRSPPLTAGSRYLGISPPSLPAW